MHKILQQAPGKAKHCYASSRHPTLERKKRLIMTGFVPTGRVWPYLPDDNNTSNCILVSPLPPDVREQGWHGGEGTRLPTMYQYGPGFKSWS